MLKSFTSNSLGFAIVLVFAASSGCAVLPEISHEPTLHNPFPQISQVAIAPFYNLTGDDRSGTDSLNGQKVALAYGEELQKVPGFEVVPVGVTETCIRQYNLHLEKGEDCQRLARLLDVDAVVLGSVTDFNMYRPPHMSLKVKWYAANPYFHPIPAGYGLPWGTSREKDIPGPVVFESEMELAKAQLKTQTPHFNTPDNPASASKHLPGSLPNDPAGVPTGIPPGLSWSGTDASPDSSGQPALKWRSPLEAPPSEGSQKLNGKSTSGSGDARTISHEEPIPNMAEGQRSGGMVSMAMGMEGPQVGPSYPPDWPDPRGFVPRPPTAHPQPSGPSNLPVMEHIGSYHGNDAEFTTALQAYYHFHDDERLGGWERYLERSDDFIRFCCHMHIWEMLSARGGAGESRVVWRWSPIR